MDLSAPLDDFEPGTNPEVQAEVEEADDNNDKVKELEVEEFDTSQAKFEKRTGNYTKLEDVCLIHQN